jgi:hypothetical protein
MLLNNVSELYANKQINITWPEHNLIKIMVTWHTGLCILEKYMVVTSSGSDNGQLLSYNGAF